MKNIVTIAAKELKIYYVSPIAYVVTTVFLAISDLLFYQITVNYSILSSQVLQTQGMLPQLSLHSAVFRPSYLNMSVILLLIMPMLTMRLLSEEKKSRTAELLMTSPVTITEVILGKFFASYVVYFMMLLLTLHIPVILSGFSHVDWRPLLPSYLGLFLLGGVFLSLGLFASSLTENQVIAAVISLGIFLSLWLIGVTTQTTGSSNAAAVIGYLSIVDHFDNFTKGLLDTRDIVYFVSLILLGLFLTHRVVESQRWK